MLKQATALLEHCDEGLVRLLEEHATHDRDVVGKGSVRQHWIDDWQSVAST